MSYAISYAVTESEAGWKKVQDDILKDKLPTVMLVGGGLLTISCLAEPLLVQYLQLSPAQLQSAGCRLNPVSSLFAQHMPQVFKPPLTVQNTSKVVDAVAPMQQLQAWLQRNARLRAITVGSCVMVVAVQSLLVFQRGIKEYQHEVAQGIAAISIRDSTNTINQLSTLPIRMIHSAHELTRPLDGNMLFISPSTSHDSYSTQYFLQQKQPRSVLPVQHRAAPQLIANALQQCQGNTRTPSVSIQSHDLHQVDTPTPTSQILSKNEALISAFSFANDLYAQIYQLQHQKSGNALQQGQPQPVIPLNILHISDDESLFALWKMSTTSGIITPPRGSNQNVHNLVENIKKQFLPKHVDLEIDDKFLRTFESVLHNNMTHVPFSLTPVNKGQLSLINIKGFLVLEIIRQVAEKLPIYPDDGNVKNEAGKLTSTLAFLFSVLDSVEQQIWHQVTWCGQLVAPAVSVVGTTMMDMYAMIGAQVIYCIDTIGTVVSGLLGLENIVPPSIETTSDAASEGAVALVPVSKPNGAGMKSFTLSDVLTSNKCTIILDDLAPTTSSTGTTSSALAQYLMKELSKFGLKSTTLSKLEEHTMMEDVTTSVMTLSERAVYSAAFLGGMLHELLWEGYHHGVSLIASGQWAKMSNHGMRLLTYQHYRNQRSNSNNGDESEDTVEDHPAQLQDMATCQVIISIVQSEEEALYRTFLLTRKYPKCHIILIAYGGQYKESYYENEEIHSSSKKKKRVGFIDAKQVMEKIWG